MKKMFDSKFWFFILGMLLMFIVILSSTGLLLRLVVKSNQSVISQQFDMTGSYCLPATDEIEIPVYCKVVSVIQSVPLNNTIPVCPEYISERLNGAEVFFQIQPESCVVSTIHG